MATVRGQATIYWTVDLPEGKERGKDTDPAIEAVLGFIPQSGLVYLWGRDPADPAADVFVELDEADIEIEEDNRYDPLDKQ